MNRDQIGVHVERALYAEAMGKCMNPDCHTDLFIGDGDIMERAHIDAYCESKDNSFENLVILCPSCHTKFDKLHLFTAEQIREWKKTRRNEVERFFSRKFTSFDELGEVVIPILLENKSILEPRILFEDISPRTHLIASEMFDFPLPLGPTITVAPDSNRSLVLSGKDLNP